MLKLNNITKTYGQDDYKVDALRGISVRFPQNGVISVLGASGCGKTTLLNIIGALDKYTSGDLIIDGVSTKNYKNADWDSYRNHTVGFVFQNYYLIPHLNVLENVTIAMDLAGLNVEEQKEKAKVALEKVGLISQLKKKPKQLSGGQAQRVAIARAIANQPKIILADEPTGALDSENSVQILEILRELSKDALIIIVTHNAELAEKYSDRIIKMSDGRIIDDISKCESTETAADETPVSPEPKKKKRPTMGIFSAFKNSLKNLYYKKGRTILTAVAGCIGVVSIATILALNSGFSAYATNYQRDSLAKYPLAVYKTQSSLDDIGDVVNQMSGNDFTTLDTNTIMNILGDKNVDLEAYTDEEKVYIEKLVTGLGASLDDLMKENDTTEFKKYVDANFDKSLATVKYDYDIDLNVYNGKTTNQGVTNYTKICPFSDRTADSLNEFNSLLSVIGLKLSSHDIQNVHSALSNINFWDAMVDDQTVLESQYNLLEGSWPKDNVNENIYEVVLVVDEYNRLSDASLYALGYIEFNDLLQSLLLNSKDILSKLTDTDFNIAIGKELKLEYDFKDFIKHEFKLVLEPDYYAPTADGKFEDKRADKNYVNDIAANGATVRVSGIVRLKDTVASGCIDGDIGYTQNLVNYIINGTDSSAIVTAQKAEFASYLEKISTERYAQYVALAKRMANEEITFDELTQEEQLLIIEQSQINIKSVINGTNDMADVSAYDTLLLDLGVKDKDEPNAILFYPTSVDAVGKIEKFITDYNVVMKEKYENGETKTNNTVEYKNELKSLMNSLNEIISTITYILIAVTCLAVIVSLFMVGIIMYISVQDRTKEIGILRSMGARSFDIMNIFNSETMLLGLLSGIIGIALSYALAPAFNALLANYLSISGLIQPVWWQSLVLIGASIVLTAISGLPPAILAAKKNPVSALRTE